MDTAIVSTSKSIDLTTTDNYCSTEPNIIMKFRRLKLKENLIAKSIFKTREDFTDNYDTFDINYSEMANTANLKKSYIEIRDLFEEIKENTISRNGVQSLDIDEVKKDIMNLEAKIQNFSDYLQTHLKSLKLSELDLSKQIDENLNKDKRKRPTKVQVKAMTEIVSSPVKNIINSPFKCPEVQQLQEFMASSKNRYGGWIPYNHVIFEKTWHKYFSIHKNTEDFEYQEVNVENSKLFPLFINEISKKVTGVDITDIIAHNRWYTKYVYLKERQQNALEKWRIKKRLIKTSRVNSATYGGEKYKLEKTKDTIQFQTDRSKSDGDINYLYELSQSELRKYHANKIRSNAKKQGDAGFQDFITEIFKDADTLNEQETLPDPDFTNELDSNYKSKLLSTYNRPTEQWYHRCNDESKAYHKINNNVENIRKRRVPDWRLVLLQSE